ncbi:MAG: co-chaperone GroES [Gemmatimonadales bacterium]|uniref:co-chaperone GroES n=1 Tax=Candidatus Palauibacter irciniicola TaxID=3056733 RepID=UPI001380D81F|nr:co-chaperone GroES [Candidatus Palauibacter irciniicola]MYC18405.1 co-chaperone GroES [Gemmatimonadales bacterium]
MATASNTKLNISPMADRVVIAPLEETEEMRGGLYIPDTAKEKPQQGTVVAVGPGRMNDDGDRIPMEVSTGDRVLYGKYAGTEVSLDGDDYLIVKESDVLAVL